MRDLNLAFTAEESENINAAVSHSADVYMYKSSLLLLHVTRWEERDQRSRSEGDRQTDRRAAGREVRRQGGT